MKITPELEAVAGAIQAHAMVHGPDYEGMARAALKTLRTAITDDTVRAGLEANTCDLPGGSTITMAVEPAWEAMIDHILGDAA